MASYEKNPFIVYYVHQLIDKKLNIDQMDPEKVEQLEESLYTRFESMLGRNIVESLPEENREAYMREVKGMNLKKDAMDMDRMAALLKDVNMENINFQEIMKFTLQELSDEFLKQ